MGTSVAFLTELMTQRSTALQDLHEAQTVGDEAAAAVALARIQDLDELLSRNGGHDLRLDVDVVACSVPTAVPAPAPAAAAEAPASIVLDDPALDTLTA